MLKPILASALLVVLILALLWAGQRRMIYLPFGAVAQPSSVGLSFAEQVEYTTEDDLSLRGWFVPARTSPPLFTMIVFNGNAGHRGFRAPLALALADRGVATLLTDYRGFGGNPGSPSEQGLARDARAARAYVTSRPDVDSSRIVYFGESLGSGVAVRLALEKPPLAMVLRSPYTSLTDVGRHHYPFLPVTLLLKDRFHSAELIDRVQCPVLVIAGERDEIVPLRLSQQLYARVQGAKRMVTIAGAKHNDFELLAGERLVAEIMSFLREEGRARH